LQQKHSHLTEGKSSETLAPSAALMQIVTGRCVSLTCLPEGAHKLPTIWTVATNENPLLVYNKTGCNHFLLAFS